MMIGHRAGPRPRPRTRQERRPIRRGCRGILTICRFQRCLDPGLPDSGHPDGPDRGARHGYALAQRITELGLGPVRGGALYPVLGRLESDGVIESLWQAGDGGPGKKVYSLTDAGHRRLDTERAAWRDFSAALNGLLGATTQEQT